MFKVLLIGGLIALSAAAALVDNPDDNNGQLKCLYENELWGSVDGTKFYFCLDANTVIEQSCPENTFFVRNETACGCVPLEMVDTRCVYSQNEVEPCTGENLIQPQPALNPTQFYVCPKVNASPMLLTCSDGRAFVKENGYMGCFKWTEWRTLRQCPE